MKRNLTKIYTKEYFDYEDKYAGRLGKLKDTAKAVLGYYNGEENFSILDVGCGRGYLVDFLRNKGFSAFGLDGSEEACNGKTEYIRQLDVVEGIPYKDKSFDVVISTDFFEHIDEENIDFVYSEMKRVAKKAVIARICYKKDKSHDLHCTIRERDWWQRKLPECILL